MATGIYIANAGKSSAARVRSKLLSGRIIFELVLLAIAIGYGSVGLHLSLDTLDGTLGGPGLFPQVLAAGLVVSLLLALIQDLRKAWQEHKIDTGSETAIGSAHNLKAVVLQAVLLSAFVYGFAQFGVWLAAPIYIIVGMATIERPFKIMPLLYALAVSLAFLYVLDFVLHANLP
jgi:hypothetical protein